MLAARVHLVCVRVCVCVCVCVRLSLSLSLSLSLYGTFRADREASKAPIFIFLASTPPPCLTSAPTGHTGGLWLKPADPVRAQRTCFDNRRTCVDIRGPQRQFLFGAWEVVTGRVNGGGREDILESQCTRLILFTN